jgi:hypothetical protein
MSPSRGFSSGTNALVSGRLVVDLRGPAWVPSRICSARRRCAARAASRRSSGSAPRPRSPTTAPTSRARTSARAPTVERPASWPPAASCSRSPSAPVSGDAQPAGGNTGLADMTVLSAWIHRSSVDASASQASQGRSAAHLQGGAIRSADDRSWRRHARARLARRGVGCGTGCHGCCSARSAPLRPPRSWRRSSVSPTRACCSRLVHCVHRPHGRRGGHPDRGDPDTRRFCRVSLRSVVALRIGIVLVPAGAPPGQRLGRGAAGSRTFALAIVSERRIAPADVP